MDRIKEELSECCDAPIEHADCEECVAGELPNGEDCEDCDGFGFCDDVFECSKCGEQSR